jgi:hypothetical protein
MLRMRVEAGLLGLWKRVTALRAAFWLG